MPYIRPPPPPRTSTAASPTDDGEPSSPLAGGVLVVGNHCHDVLFLDGRVIGESLGGSTSFISNVLDPILPTVRYVSKVGPDFPHDRLLSQAPLPSSSPTTLFHALFSSAPSRSDRVLRRVRSCDAILPSDLPDPQSNFHFGVAAGVAGEIPSATLVRMLDLCRVVFVDAQAMIREFDPVDGTVRLIPLRETEFSHLLPRVSFLKASADEAEFVDVEEARWLCCVVVTRGEEGCCLYWRHGEISIPAFAARQVDPTGAGDSFLGGFIAGLAYGLNIADAALLGNFFGSLAVRKIGLPMFQPCVLQAVRNKLKQKASGTSVRSPTPLDSLVGVDFDGEFQNFLAKISKTAYDDDYVAIDNGDGRDCIKLGAWTNLDDKWVIPNENGL